MLEAIGPIYDESNRADDVSFLARPTQIPTESVCRAVPSSRTQTGAMRSLEAARVAELETKLIATESECLEVKAKLDLTAKECAKVSAKLARTEEECAAVKVELAAMQKEYSDMKTKLTLTEAEWAANWAKLSEVDDSLNHRQLERGSGDEATGVSGGDEHATDGIVIGSHTNRDNAVSPGTPVAPLVISCGNPSLPGARRDSVGTIESRVPTSPDSEPEKSDVSSQRKNEDVIGAGRIPGKMWV